MALKRSQRIKLLEKVRSLTLAGEYDEALEDVTLALSNNPEDEDALALKGNILELIEHYAEARACYEKVLELNPNNTQAWIDLGDHYTNKEENDKALQYYDGAINLIGRGIIYVSKTHEVEQAYFGKASLLKAAGRLTEALVCAQEGLQLAPDAELLRNFH
ncbi:MAG: tetratricopeptide repeat protein [Candidatus Omnitrophica bacterium]|nr:tetratricopeptide repeat protein [Candidatus Omnitrophota bacterium]